MRTLLIFILSICGASYLLAWELALPGHAYVFPQDHLAHPEFKTEWWYFTGHVQAADGRRFGYQVTFFRQGIQEQRPPGELGVRDISFAHAAITEIDGGRFHFDQLISRGVYGMAGFGGLDRVAWIGDWQLKWTGDGGWEMEAAPAGQKIRLRARPVKPVVIHGENGVSQKAAGQGQASHYYSHTRLETAGELVMDGKNIPVKGVSWFDHEWATNQLGREQIGWNWFSLQFADGSELMLYQMRRADGTADPVSSGTWVPAAGSPVHLSQADFVMKPEKRTWRSPLTRASYPLDWRIEVTSLDLLVTTRAQLDRQEMALTPVVYWEGAIEADGTKAGQALRGSGYMELTGYGDALRALQTR